MCGLPRAAGAGYRRGLDRRERCFPCRNGCSVAEQAWYPGTCTKLPLPPDYNATSGDIDKLAQQDLPPNVTVNTTGDVKPKPPDTDGHEDDDSIHLGVDSSIGGNLGGYSGVPVQVSLVLKNFNIHAFRRKGKQFVDIMHEPSLNLTLTFDGVHIRDVQPAAQLAVSAVNLHILQNSEDDILEAALTGGSHAISRAGTVPSACNGNIISQGQACRSFSKGTPRSGIRTTAGSCNGPTHRDRRIVMAHA